MRFFTIEWWHGDDSGDAISAYQVHFDAIRDRPPPGLVEIHESVSLHDGWLRNLRIDVAGKTLDMHIDTDDGRGGLRKVHVQYLGVSSYTSLAEPETGLGGPRGYGDLGYHEVAFENGAWVHRLLFSSNIEMEIRFDDFVLD